MVTESEQEIVGSIPQNSVRHTYVYQLSTLIYFGVEVKFTRTGKDSAENTKNAGHYTSHGYSFRIYVNFAEILK